MKFVDDVIFFTSRPLSLVVLCVWFLCSGVFSGLAATNAVVQYSSRTWQTDEGLPQNSVQAVAQTRDGYLWVGTVRGLARFDGARFTIFDSHNTPELKQSWISALYQTHDGILWIGTVGGGLVQLQNDHFKHLDIGGSNNARTNSVKCILEAQNGDVWIGTLGGLFRYHQGAWSMFTTNDGLRDNVVRSLCEVGDQLWIGTGLGLNILKNGKLTTQAGLQDKSIRFVYRDIKSNIWLGLTVGLTCIHPDKKIIHYSRKDGLPDVNVTTLFEDHHGNLWVGTYGGLCRWSENKFVVETDSQGGFYDQVNSMMEDSEGDMWVGARDGLHELRSRLFLTYTRQQGLSHNNVMSVLEDRNGSMWVGTWGGGLNRLKQNGEITGFTKETNGSNSIGSDLVLSLYEDRDGSILAGTDYEGGAFRFSDNKFTRLWNQGEAATNRVARVIHRDREGNLWFGLSPGLMRAGSTHRYLPQFTIRCIFEDSQNNLWIGSNDGLFCRHGDTFTREPEMAGITHHVVISMHEDAEHVLWIGTEGGGLCRYANKQLTIFTTEQGLWSDEVFEILEDDHGWLWMSCPRGIFRVNKSNLAEVAQKRGTIASIAYGKADGMESIQCSGVAKPAGWKARDGRLWFATTKGVVVTDPNSDLGRNEKPPPVLIEEVYANKHAINLADESSVHIEPGRGELEFHYTALSLAVPEKNRFRYKLEGVNPEWVDAGTRRVAYYTNLRPGNYRFRVMGCNSDGVWNATEDEITVVLAPRIWEAWWFKSLAIIIAGGGLFGVVRYGTRKKINRELERLEHQHAIEKERTRIAQDMHDDLGSRLTEILLLNELAQKNKTSFDKLETHLSRQTHVVRDVAGSLDTIVWAVNPVNDSIDRLANYLYEQVERILTMRSIRCRFDVPDELPDYFLSSEVRHNVFLVVREALNNIIKHAGATEVWFRLRTSQSALFLAIEDNGKGLPDAENSSFGNGLHNMARRMKHLGGYFRLSSQPGKGTQIKLEVPIKPIADQRKTKTPKRPRGVKLKSRRSPQDFYEH